MEGDPFADLPNDVLWLVLRQVLLGLIPPNPNRHAAQVLCTGGMFQPYDASQMGATLRSLKQVCQRWRAIVWARVITDERRWFLFHPAAFADICTFNRERLTHWTRRG